MGMLLFTILLVLFLSIFVIIFMVYLGYNQKKIQRFSLNVSIVCFYISIFFWIFFDTSCSDYQYLLRINFWNISTLHSFVNHICFGIDGISLFFILLTTFLIPLCLLTTFKINFIKISEFCLYFIVLEIILIFSFISIDLICFFYFFESILIPMFFIIGIWGSRDRRVWAAFYFFLYTLFGSVFLFFSVLVIYYDIGITSFYLISKVSIDFNKQVILWLFLYLAFSVKIPTIPMHLWLCEAHVESPTAGSVILAGLLLKLGGYAFLRIILPVFSKATIYFLPLVDTLALISIIYASLTTIRQVDMKRIIAYSSIAHMNLVVLGIFSNNIQGISGSIFLMLAHGIVSSALFFLIGILYDKYYTRIILYYGGLVQTMPLFSFFLLVFCLANIGLPGSCNFIGELVIFIGLVERNFVVCIISVTGVVFSVIYTMFFFNRLVFGNLNLSFIFEYQDLLKREFYILCLCLFLTIYLGIIPNIVFNTIYMSVSVCIDGLF